MRALPALATQLPARSRPVTEGKLWPVMLSIGFALGLIWAFLPSGLEFNAAVRDANSESGGLQGLFALQWMPLILLGLAAIAARFRLAVLVIRDINPWIVALPLWAMASMLWAPDAFQVFKQSVGISGVVILALGFCLYGWHQDRYQTVLRPVVTWALGLSLLVGIVMPDIGIHSEQQFELQGSWRGITFQKNALGQVAAVGMIFWFYAWASRTEKMLHVGLGLGLSLLMILLSRSSTSLLLTIICCGTILLRLRPPLRTGRHHSIVTATGWLMVLLPLFCYLIFIGTLDGEVIAGSIGEVFGKDATFSGRTMIWAEVLRLIEQRPLLGVGYNSYWLTPLALESQQRLGWPCPSGHNGYLDIWLTLGLVGISLLILYFVRQFADLARLSKIDRNRAALHFALLLYVILANLTESAWYVPMAIVHIVAIYSSVCVSRLLFDARLRMAAEQSQKNPQTVVARLHA